MRHPLWFVLTKTTLLSGLLVFYLFWFVPTTRSQLAYRQAMDRTFYEGQDCWERKYREGDYDGSSHCYDKWEQWQYVNNSPEPGWHLPWSVWKEK
jgi:hypothetical protein